MILSRATRARSLSTLVALRWFDVDDTRRPLPIETFYWLLLGLLVTVASTYRHVADALDAGEPSDIKAFQAWLKSTQRDALSVVEIPFALAFTGLRWEEAVAVPISNLNRDSQWMIIDRTASESGGRRDVREDMKTRAAARS